MSVSGSAGPPGGDNPPGRTRRGGRALVGCAHPGAPLRQVLTLEILIIDIENHRMVVLLKTTSAGVSFIKIMQIRVQNKRKSVRKSRYDGDVSLWISDRW